MFDNEEICILLIEDEDAQAKAFHLQILKNPNLRLNNVRFQHCHSIQEAMNWLSSSGITPYLICLDLGLPDLSTANFDRVYKDLALYAPENSIIGLTGQDQENSLFRALEKRVGKDQVFLKQSVWNNQDALLSSIREIVHRRSSGRSREMQMDVVRMEGRLENCEEEIGHLEKLVDRINQAIFMSGQESLAYLVTRQQQQILALEDRVRVLSQKVESLESSQSSGNLQLKLADRTFLQKVGFVLAMIVVVIGLIRLLGLGIEEVTELIRTLIS